MSAVTAEAKGSVQGRGVVGIARHVRARSALCREPHGALDSRRRDLSAPGNSGASRSGIDFAGDLAAIRHRSCPSHLPRTVPQGFRCPGAGAARVRRRTQDTLIGRKDPSVVSSPRERVGANL